MDVVRNALQADAGASVAGHGAGFEAKLVEIDNPIARDRNRNGYAKLLQCQRQRAKNIGQAAHFGERNTLRCDHQDPDIRHEMS